MASVTPQLVKQLRDQTGAGMSDCKKALEEAQADFDKAVTLLREKGLAAAAKKSASLSVETVAGPCGEGIARTATSIDFAVLRCGRSGTPMGASLSRKRAMLRSIRSASIIRHGVSSIPMRDGAMSGCAVSGDVASLMRCVSSRRTFRS